MKDDVRLIFGLIRQQTEMEEKRKSLGDGPCATEISRSSRRAARGLGKLRHPVPRGKDAAEEWDRVTRTLP